MTTYIFTFQTKKYNPSTNIWEWTSMSLEMTIEEWSEEYELKYSISGVRNLTINEKGENNE